MSNWEEEEAPDWLNPEPKKRRKKLSLKPKDRCDEHTCHARGCSVVSEMTLERSSAALYDRDRVELCDDHYVVHCGES